MMTLNHRLHAHHKNAPTDPDPTARRLYVLAASTGSYPNSAYPFRTVFAAPTAGGAIDGVSTNLAAFDADSADGKLDTSLGNNTLGNPAHRGVLALVEASASFAVGASLVTGTDGRVATGSGTVVLRALQASAGAGSLVWCVFL